MDALGSGWCLGRHDGDVRVQHEVDLTAPYDSIPVVYGLLELQADTQWVKINRTWLGEGNQLLAAQVADSSEYLQEAWMRASSSWFLQAQEASWATNCPLAVSGPCATP